jgi:hypothetical protein
MQLIRLNTWPTGRRGNGLFVVLVNDVAERAAVAELSDGLNADADLAQSNAGMAQLV